MYEYGYRQNTKAVVQSCFVKKVFLEFSQNSQEKTCARVFFNKVAELKSAPLLKKRLWHRCFPVNFVKYLRTPFLTGHLWWLLLYERLHLQQQNFYKYCEISKSVFLSFLLVN